MKLALAYLFIVIFFSGAVLAAEIKRTHSFVRSIAMGDAFTAVADSKETIGYNPAGLLQNGVEWTLTVPVFGAGFNEIVKNWNNTETERDFSDTSTLGDLQGARIYTETQVPLMASLFIPNKGIYTGFDADLRMEIVFPPQTIIPTVSIEAIAQAVYNFAMAFELWGFYVGSTAKLIYRQGIVADLDLLSIAVYLDNDDIQGLIDEYAEDQPQPKIAFDFGLLYRFDNPWRFRIGVSSLDMLSMDLGGESTVTYGGINYGSAGEVSQLNSIGFAFTKEIDGFFLTGSLDYHDFTYSYFPTNSVTRRIAIGFEAAYGRNHDNSRMASVQLGLKELKYPSLGFGYNLGFLEFNTVGWVENFGTEKTEILDTRYMFLISLVF